MGAHLFLWQRRERGRGKENTVQQSMLIKNDF